MNIIYYNEKIKQVIAQQLNGNSTINAHWLICQAPRSPGARGGFMPYAGIRLNTNVYFGFLVEKRNLAPPLLNRFRGPCM